MRTGDERPIGRLAFQYPRGSRAHRDEALIIPLAAETGFEAGATVYMTCSVFGLHFQNDRTSARMSHKVLGPQGQVLVDSPDFLDLSKQEYYRPAIYSVPVWGELTIPSEMKKGIYTDQYSVVDNLTNQTITQEVKFEVR